MVLVVTSGFGAVFSPNAALIARVGAQRALRSAQARATIAAMSTRHILTGTRIRERRLALSRRQSDVARAAGISPAYLNLIEHNRRPVAEALIARLAEALDVPQAELEAGREEARIAALREAAARLDTRAGPGGVDVDPDALPRAETGPELDQAPEFVARFPGWAGALISTARKAESLERRLITLSDRMRQDPHLLATLHEILSAVTSVRSAASILAEGDASLPPEWAARFHANLDEDSLRLSTTAQALVSYLDSFETEDAALTPREEVEAWIASGMPPLDQAPELASDAARAMARGHLDRMAAERGALPDAALASAASALAAGAGGGSVDPLALAQALGAPVDLVMRRIAVLQPPPFRQAGLLVCDGSGALTLRRPSPGFPMPRLGDACALWPIFQALAQPHLLLRSRVVTPDGARFDCFSHAARSQPIGIGGPVLIHAQMLILPVGPAAGDPGMAGGGGGAYGGPVVPAIAIGPSCRICPRGDCPARREPSILAPA